LEKSEEQYRLAQKVSNIGSWDWTILTGGLKWSETIEPIFGFEKGAFKKTYEAFLQCLHPDDRQFVTDSVNACIEHKKEYNIEHRIIWPDGSIHWVHEIGNVIRNNEGKAVRMLGIVHDITERKKFEEEVNRLASFPEKDPNPILETDTSGSLIYINPIAQELFPDLKNAGLKHPFLKGITPQILKNLQKKPIRPLSIEVTVGNKSYLQTLCYIPENQRIHVYSMDITKLKDAEETLKQSEEKYRGIVENTTNLIMMTQPDGTISYLSPSCKKVLGYPSKDLLGKNLTIIHPDDAKKVQQTLYKSLKGEKGSGLEYRIITKQGKTKWISHSWSPIFINKKIQSVVSIIEDISNRKETENNIKELNENLLYQAIKLEATNKELEAFSYSVSHDLRAPLRSIEGFSQALLEDYEKKLDETGVDYLNRVCNATRKMSQLIEDMLKLSRLTRSEMAIDTVDLGQTAEDIINKFKQADPKRTIDFIKPGNLIVKGDPDLLTIALENLLSNAWKFTKNSKKAKIEFGKLKKEPETVFFIKDNGAGFDMKYADKLFTPFQRLHSDDDYKGTGIGLSIVSRIIHRHGGRIWAEAEENKGATFYFTLQGKNHK
jgi:PAS domain S-box-containing protein